MQDSRSIENAFQKLAEENESKPPQLERGGVPEPGDKDSTAIRDTNREANTSMDHPSNSEKGGSVKVPVQEDYLFDVDIEKRELGPVYWMGPIFDVKRGTWFQIDGSTNKPCDENLATQVEEGYLKVMPWLNPASGSIGVGVKEISKEPSAKKAGQLESDHKISPKASKESLKTDDPPKESLKSQRLFGPYSNAIVTYVDANTAWLVTDDLMSRMSSTVYAQFGGGGHFGGTKLTRGYTELGKPKDGKADASNKTGESQTRQEKTPQNYKRRSAPPSTASGGKPAVLRSDSDLRKEAIEHSLTKLVSRTDAGETDLQTEEERGRDQEDVQEDYSLEKDSNQDREIEHLLLVTHGIGQRLGLRMESVNFVHDVNVLRKNIKSVYDNSPDLQALNAEVEALPKNCRVQVLPVNWRHLLDFPRQSLKRNREEHDLGDSSPLEDEEDYPSLQDITLEGVPAVRAAISDIGLDILLFHSAYREQISSIVLAEVNRIYSLFMQRNPNFKGKVSLLGHSLGSAIYFDILSRAKGSSDLTHATSDSKAFYHNRPGVTQRNEAGKDAALVFPVENLFCLGSPIGLFQMLKGRTIAARHSLDGPPPQTPFDIDTMDDPFLGAASTTNTTSVSKESKIYHPPFTVSSPNCNQLFNIFHPMDPIAYRLEPLISPSMASLKPQPLPYTKKGIFGAPMGLTDIGTRVSQSVTGLWSSFSSGIASGLINRSLGLTAEDAKSRTLPISAETAQKDAKALQDATAAAAGTGITAGGVVPAASVQVNAGVDVKDDAKKQRLAQDTLLSANSLGETENLPTLIDNDLDTLYAGFQKRRKSQQSDEGRDLGPSPEWEESEERARRLRREEAKVRALNRTGRVDFSVQEGVFDISLIASIASHLSYWGDEDVSHFMLSQLLSSQKGGAKRKRSVGGGKQQNLEA